MKQYCQVNQEMMLVDDELSLYNNTATETEKMVMPSSVEIVKTTKAGKANVQGEDIALPGNVNTQFATHRDGDTTEEAQLVTSEATLSNVNIVEGDTGVECSFYRGVCRVHRIKGTKNQSWKKGCSTAAMLPEGNRQDHFWLLQFTADRQGKPLG